MRATLASVLLALACARAPVSPLDVQEAMAGENADAIENFKKGDAALSSDNWQEAAKYFEHVRSKYPFSALAPLAELRLADTHLSRDRFAEAGDAFRNFVKLHPNHPKVDYASFRAAVAAYKEIPSDFFLFPPSVEKEQVHVKAALRAFEDFLAAYPSSTWRDEAGKLRDDCRRRLAEHEMSVARFYRRHDKLRATVQRLETLLREYPGVEQEPEAMLELGRIHVDLKEIDKGREVLRKLIAKYPKRTESSSARALLETLG